MGFLWTKIVWLCVDINIAPSEVLDNVEGAQAYSRDGEDYKHEK